MSLSREELVNRKLPFMSLSTNENRLTSPPEPFPASLSAAEKAAKRFAIEGNAIGMSGNTTLRFACYLSYMPRRH